MDGSAGLDTGNDVYSCQALICDTIVDGMTVLELGGSDLTGR